MFLFDDSSRKRVPLCFSIDTLTILRNAFRRRHGVGRRALSLAAVHDPPDKPAAEHGPMARLIAERNQGIAVDTGSNAANCLSFQRRKRNKRR
jgi:hypothetical protein